MTLRPDGPFNTPANWGNMTEMQKTIQLFRPHSRGRFLFRKNRFVIRVIHEDGYEIDVHAPNPGKLLELYLPGTEVLLEKHSNPNRKLPWSLAALRHKEAWVPMVSAAANELAAELAIPALYPDAENLRREVKSGDHRLDLTFSTRGGSSQNRIQSWMAEVKSCSLVEDGVAMFPDAPSTRAYRHVEHLIRLQQSEEISALILFVINHGCPEYFIPNYHNDPQFALKLLAAVNAGVAVRRVVSRSDSQGRTCLVAPPGGEPRLLFSGMEQIIREDSGVLIEISQRSEKDSPWHVTIGGYQEKFGKALRQSAGGKRVRIPVRCTRSSISEIARRFGELLAREAQTGIQHSEPKFRFPHNPLHVRGLNRGIFDLRHRISREQLGDGPLWRGPQ